MKEIDKLYEFINHLNDLNFREYEKLIFEILLKSDKFSEVKFANGAEAVFYDIILLGKNPFPVESINNENQHRLLVNLKHKVIITPDLLRFQKIHSLKADDELILITTGILTEEAKIYAYENKISVWATYQLYNLLNFDTDWIFRKHINIVEEPIQNYNSQLPKEDFFIDQLKKMESGKKSYFKYQKLISDILSHLFCPPLDPPRYEFNDEDGRNRRDMIFENSSTENFWLNIRSIYKADYIVVDAKNHKDPIDKDSVIELAHYLKPYGCGMFGILATRNGASEGGKHAIREQWIGNTKMIIVLSDKDIFDMLNLKSTNGKPEDILRVKISDFRMKL